MKKIFPLIWLLFICQEAPVLAVTQITDSLYVKQGAEITRLYTDSAALRTMTLSGSPIGTPGDSCMFLNLGVPVHCTKAQVLAWLGSSGITSINTGTAAAHTIVGEQGLQVLDSGTNLYKHVIVPATGYIIPTGSNMRVDSTTLADSAADAGKWGGNVYGGPYLGLHATADTSIAADRARKLATTRTIGKSTTFDGTANIVPDSAVSVVQATQLTTARTIGNTSFNGTANIIPDTCNKANRARYADSSGATHKADTSISSHQSAQLTTAVNIGNVSFNGTAAIIPDTANKANRARYSDSTGKIPDTVHIRLGLSANNINVSNVQTTNLNGTAIGSAYSVVGASPALSLTAGYIPKAATTTTLSNSALRDNGSYFMDITGTNPIFKLAGTSNNDNPEFMLYHLNDQIWAFSLQGSTPITGSANKDLTINDGGNNNFITLKSGGPVLLAPNADRNVGIETTSPLTNLQIGNRYGLINISTNTELSNNLYYNSGWKYLTSSYGSSFEQDGSGNFYFYTAPSGTAGNSASLTTVMSILLNGNVGIGTTSPSQKLHIQGTGGGSAGIYINSATPSSTTYTLHNNGGNLYWNGNLLSLGTGGTLVGSGTTNYITKWTGTNNLGSSTMLYDIGTAVGIGTTSPDSQFTTSAGAHIGGGLLVGGAATINNNVTVKGGNDNTFDLDNDGSRYTYQYFRNNGNIKGSLGYDNTGNAFWMGSDAVNASTVIQSGNGSEAMRILSNGNVGIGTTSPGYPLDVRGLINASNAGGTANVYMGVGGGEAAIVENNARGISINSNDGVVSLNSDIGASLTVGQSGVNIQGNLSVSGNDTVGGQIRAGGLYTTGYDTSYYGYTLFTTANQMVVDTFNIRHSEKLYDSIATMTTTFTFDCAHMRPLCTMTSATAGGTVSFINISDGLVFIFINATANSINLTLTYGTVGLGAHQGMTLICSQTSIFEEL